MNVSTLLLVSLFVSAQSDGTPLAKSAKFSDEFQWKATEASIRLGVRFGEGSMGSAIAIANKDNFTWALTAYHVVRESSQIDAQFYGKAKYPAHLRSQNGVSVVARNPTIDVALIKIPMAADVEAPTVLPLLPPGQRPKQFPVPVLAVGCDDGFSPKCFGDQILSKRLIRRPESQIAFFWETESPPREGRSGGGLIDEKGNVIGICSARQDGRGSYTHLDEIHAWLKKEGQEWLWTDNKPK
ncbi:hypothetical protein BH11PLA2_BH11PLA2_46070 [soil metagenome]